MEEGAATNPKPAETAVPSGIESSTAEDKTEDDRTEEEIQQQGKKPEDEVKIEVETSTPTKTAAAAEIKQTTAEVET